MTQLSVEDLHKRYGDHEVLKGVSLATEAGDVVSIIGSSGSGKSTFLRCINFLEQPDAGRITVAGEEIRLVPDRNGHLKVADARQLQRLRTRLAMVFQHFNLWAHMTVLENVTEAPLHVLGLSRAEARERAEAYLEKVGIAQFMDSYPPIFRAASSSVWRSPAHSPWNPRCCSSTSLPRRSTRSSWAKCSGHARPRRGRPHHGGGHP